MQFKIKFEGYEVWVSGGGRWDEFGWHASTTIFCEERYLHTDGYWRSSTEVRTNGKSVFSGYFPTKEALLETLSRAKGVRDLPPEAFQDPDTIELMKHLCEISAHGRIIE